MLWIVIPAKAPPYAKSRLSGALADARRGELVEAMAKRTLLVARESGPTAKILLVSNSHSFRAMARSLGACAIADEGEGINEALRVAEAMLSPRDAMLVLPTDLPLLTAEDINAMVNTGTGCAIAPDAAQVGTNALYWRAAPRTFLFGERSFEAHMEAAAKMRIAAEVVRRRNLVCDLDRPEDLVLLSPAYFRSWNPV